MKSKSPKPKGKPSTEQEAGPGRSAPTCSASLQGLSAWEVRTIRWEDDAHSKGKDWCAVIVCKDIKAVWDWLFTDLSDTRTEVRTIHHYGHVMEVIPQNVQCGGTAAAGKRRR
jgi:hypothetical protein